jgi:hypothetical protein
MTTAPRQASAQAKAQLLRMSECMRAHGITDFPDPQTGLPPSNPAGYSVVMGVNGAFLAIPRSIDPQWSAFEQAAAACNFGPRGAPAPELRPSAYTDHTRTDGFPAFQAPRRPRWALDRTWPSSGREAVASPQKQRPSTQPGGALRRATDSGRAGRPKTAAVESCAGEE